MFCFWKLNIDFSGKYHYLLTISKIFTESAVSVFITHVLLAHDGLKVPAFNIATGSMERLILKLLNFLKDLLELTIIMVSFSNLTLMKILFAQSSYTISKIWATRVSKPAPHPIHQYSAESF